MLDSTSFYSSFFITLLLLLVVIRCCCCFSSACTLYLLNLAAHTPSSTTTTTSYNNYTIAQYAVWPYSLVVVPLLRNKVHLFIYYLLFVVSPQHSLLYVIRTTNITAGRHLTKKMGLSYNHHYNDNMRIPTEERFNKKFYKVME